LGIYDLKTERLVVVNDGKDRLSSRLSSIRPDCGGFLIDKDDVGDHPPQPKSIALVDWQGKSHPITMKELDNDGLKKEAVLAELPTFFNPSSKRQIPHNLVGKWDGNTFIGRWSSNRRNPRSYQYRVRVDTEKLVGVFGKDPRDSVVPKQSVDIEYAFPEGGATVRVISFAERNWHLEVIRPGEKKPEVILGRTDKYPSLIPSPNETLLAIRITTPKSVREKQGSISDKILLLNRDGKVVNEIVETDNLPYEEPPNPTLKVPPAPQQHNKNHSKDPESKSLLIWGWGVAGGVGLLVLVAGGWTWWHRKRGK